MRKLGIFFNLLRGNSFCFISRVGSKSNDKDPTNPRVVVGGGIFPINSGKCLVKNLIIL